MSSSFSPLSRIAPSDVGSKLLTPLTLMCGKYLNGIDNLPRSSDALINALGVVWSALVISIAMTIVSFFQCYEHPGVTSGDSTFGLQSYPELLCYDTDHIPMLVLGIVNLITIFMFPFYIIIDIIRKTQNKLHEKAMETEFEEEGSNQQERLKAAKSKIWLSDIGFNDRRWYFLVARFGVENMHWAWIYLFRNMFIAFIPVLIPSHIPALQLVIFGLYCLVWAFSVLVFSPWIDIRLARLDAVILLTVATVAGWGLAYAVAEPGQEAESQSVVKSSTVVVLGLCVMYLIFCLGVVIIEAIYPNTVGVKKHTIFGAHVRRTISNFNVGKNLSKSSLDTKSTKIDESTKGGTQYQNAISMEEIRENGEKEEDTN